MQARGPAAGTCRIYEEYYGPIDSKGYEPYSIEDINTLPINSLAIDKLGDVGIQIGRVIRSYGAPDFYTYEVAYYAYKGEAPSLGRVSEGISNWPGCKKNNRVPIALV